MPPIYAKVYVLLALYASQYTILGDVQYTPPIYTNIFVSQHYIPASILHQGTSSIYRLYILVFISQHYTNISSRNYIPATRLYLGMPRPRRLQVLNYIYPPYIRRIVYLVKSRLRRLYLPRYTCPPGIIHQPAHPLYPRLYCLQLLVYTSSRYYTPASTPLSQATLPIYANVYYASQYTLFKLGYAACIY